MGSVRAVLAALFCLLLGVSPGVMTSVVGGSAAAAATGCASLPLPGAPTLKVLVMGDSLTQQFAGDATWRYRFWAEQRQQGVNIDFVGPYENLLRTWDVPDDLNTRYADPCFTETQHFAVGGKDLAETLRPLYGYPSQVAWATATYEPDVVIGLMGYNDLKSRDPAAPYGHHGYTADQVIASARAFVEQVRRGREGTPVALATVASSLTTPVVVDGRAYNAKLAAAVPTWNLPGAPVGLVDITRHWRAAPADTWDGYHPNAVGEVHLAWDVADGLNAMGLVPPVGRTDTPAYPGPAVPATVRVTGGGPGTVTLDWTYPTGADRIVVIERSNGTGWTPVCSAVRTHGCTVVGLSRTVHEFEVRAAKGTAVGPFSASVIADLSPLPVLRPTVVASVHAVTVRWPALAAADRYRVRWRASGSTAWSSRTVAATSTVVAGLRGGARYGFTVTPVRGVIAGAPGPEAVAAAGGIVNPAVAAPRLRKVGAQRVRVSWRATPAATRYQVLVRVTGGAWRTLGWSNATTFLSPKLARHRTYAIAVVAWDSYVPGRRSAAARVGFG